MQIRSNINIHLQLCFCLPDEHKLNVHSSCSSGLVYMLTASCCLSFGGGVFTENSCYYLKPTAFRKEVDVSSVAVADRQ